MTPKTPLQSAIEYVQDLVDGMDEEGLDRENNRRHYQVLIDHAKKAEGLLLTLKSISEHSIDPVMSRVAREALQQFQRGE